MYGYHNQAFRTGSVKPQGAVAELIMEIIFSPIGYRITKRWKRLSVGEEYFAYEEKEKIK